MDVRVTAILILEAAAALGLLYASGLLRRPWQVVVSALLIAAAFGARWLCLNHETLDYVNFLAVWVQRFRDGGGFAALGESFGNYNLPYLYFLAAFSYSSINDLYLIKLLSILFDIVLAFGAMKLVSLFSRDSGRQLIAFFAVLLWPTVILNGAYWGQCDSIYAAFAVLGVWLGLDRRPAAAMICMALSFAFKLQAVFILPFMVVLLIAGRVKLRHFLLFPLTYIAAILPAVLLGRPLLDTLTLYFDQLGSAGSGLNYNSPSVFGFIRGSVENASLLSTAGLIAAFALMLAVFLLVASRKGAASSQALLGAALLLCIGIPYLLPHMHDRYFFIADVLTICFAAVNPWYAALPLLVGFASFNSYYAYLKGAFLLYTDAGAAAMLLALLIVFFFTARQLYGAEE